MIDPPKIHKVKEYGLLPTPSNNWDLFCQHPDCHKNPKKITKEDLWR